MSVLAESGFAPPSPNGFTLFEALVILAILSLLAGIAFPAVEKAMRRQIFMEAALRFEHALHAARGQALRKGGPVRFAISGDRRQFGYRGALGSLPDGVVAEAPDGAVDFFADGTTSGGRLALAAAGWRRGWRVQPATGAIERVQ